MANQGRSPIAWRSRVTYIKSHGWTAWKFTVRFGPNAETGLYIHRTVSGLSCDSFKASAAALAAWAELEKEIDGAPEVEG